MSFFENSLIMLFAFSFLAFFLTLFCHVRKKYYLCIEFEMRVRIQFIYQTFIKFKKYNKLIFKVMGFTKVLVNKDEKSKQEGRNPDIYAPVWKQDLPDGKYVAYIRLLPNMINPEKTITSKETSYLRDPSDRKGHARVFDNPTTVGQKDNPITQLFWDLLDTKDPEKEQLAKDCLSTSRNYYAFIQIVSDHNLEENKNFKVMLWRFGKKMYDKIVNESEDNDILSLTSPQVLKLVLTKQGGNNNYDLSKFVDASKVEIPSAYCFLRDNTYYTVSEDMSDEDCKFVEDQLRDLEMSLNRDDMEYHPWTPEDEQVVREHCERVRLYAYPELMAGRQSFTGVAPVTPVAVHTAPVAQPVEERPVVGGVAVPISIGNSSPVVPKVQAVGTVAHTAPVAPAVAKPVSVAKPVQPVESSNGYSDDDLGELLGDD